MPFFLVYLTNLLKYTNSTEPPLPPKISCCVPALSQLIKTFVKILWAVVRGDHIPVDITEANSELSKTSKMNRLGKLLNGRETLTIFAKRLILEVWLDSAYISALHNCPNEMKEKWLMRMFSFDFQKIIFFCPKNTLPILQILLYVKSLFPSCPDTHKHRYFSRVSLQAIFL